MSEVAVKELDQVIDEDPIYSKHRYKVQSMANQESELIECSWMMLHKYLQFSFNKDGALNIKLFNKPSDQQPIVIPTHRLFANSYPWFDIEDISLDTYTFRIDKTSEWVKLINYLTDWGILK